MARRAAKTLFQACKNFLPAQGAKMEVRKSAKELINHKQQIFDFLLHLSFSRYRESGVSQKGIINFRFRKEQEL